MGRAAPRTAGLGAQQLGLSKARLLQGQSRNPTGLFPRLPPGAWGLVFRGPCPPVRRGPGCGCLPTRRCRGPTGMLPEGTALPSCGGSREGQELSARAAGAAGAGAHAGPGAQALPPPSSFRVPPVRGPQGAAKLLPEFTGRNRSLMAGVTRVLAGGRGEGRQGAELGSLG